MGHPQSSPAPMEETEKWSSSLIHTAAGRQGNTRRSHSWKEGPWLSFKGLQEEPLIWGIGGWVEGATAECGGGRRQEWKPRLTHCLKGKGRFQGYAEVPAGRGEVVQAGAPESREAQACSQILWHGAALKRDTAVWRLTCTTVHTCSWFSAW